MLLLYAQLQSNHIILRDSRDRMVVGFTNTYAISAHHRDVLDTTLCDKFVNGLWQVGGFLRFHPPIKLTTML